MVEETKAAQSKARSYEEAGNERASQGDLEGALMQYKESLRYDDSAYKIHEQVAQLHLEMDQTFPAIQAATAATKLAPTWPIGFLTLSRAQLNHGEPLLALSSISEALRLDPDNDEITSEHRHVTFVSSEWKKRQEAFEREQAQNDLENKNNASHEASQPDWKRMREHFHLLAPSIASAASSASSSHPRPHPSFSHEPSDNKNASSFSSASEIRASVGDSGAASMSLDGPAEEETAAELISAHLRAHGPLFGSFKSSESESKAHVLESESAIARKRKRDLGLPTAQP